MATSRVSYLSHLECARCSFEHDADLLLNTCYCGGPLLARYDLEQFGTDFKPSDWPARESSLSRYRELLPVREDSNWISFGEGMTPLLDLDAFGSAIGVPRLLMKDEGLLPTGTFKARGAAIGVSAARERGATRLALPSQGNAGAAWATYAARAHIPALVVMPAGAPNITRLECSIAGAEVRVVDGSIADAARLVRAAVEEDGYFDASTLKEPYRLEGKKTMAFEIVEQLGWRVPDVIVYPTGGGVGLIGIYKALRELVQIGWLPDSLPRLVAAQAAGCAPVVEAHRSGARTTDAWENAASVAFGIAIAKPFGDFLILNAIRATDGCAIAVDDDEILSDQELCGRLEGAFICPEGAAALAAVRKLRESGWLSERDEVVVLNTGSGLKYPETVRDTSQVVG